jgi:cytochrome b
MKLIRWPNIGPMSDTAIVAARPLGYPELCQRERAQVAETPAMLDSASRNFSHREVLVWDVPIRLFHWLTAALIVLAYVTWRLNWMDWHARTGNAVLTLVLFRVLWGFFGSATARFAGFVAAPRAAAEHLARFFRREADRQVGHNPAGGYMVLLLLALLFIEALSGLYIDNDIADEGLLTELTPAPIANAIDAAHWIVWYALLAAVALHVMAILIYAIVKGQNLVTPMVTGWKNLPADVRPPAIAGPLRACALLAGSAAVVALLAAML